MIKRIFDLFSALCLIAILWPVILAVAVLVAVKLGRPVLFRQERPGLYGRPFHIYKFRTMTEEKDGDGNLLPDGERLTSTGKLMRRFSLDELPQLFNVLRGEMSLVGPRPLLTEYLPLYSPEQARRHLVRPGITGWAQVNGRNAISWEEKLALDVWYVDNRSFRLDLKILRLTLVKAFRPEGVSGRGQATAEKFKGAEL